MSTAPAPSYDLLTPDPTSPAQIDLSKAIYKEDAIWGVGYKSMSFGVLSVRLLTWFDRNEGDYYAVRIKNLNAPAAFDYVRDFSDEYFLNVDKANLPEGEVQMFSRVLRTSGLESRTNTILVLIKQTLPGGNDLRWWEPWHSELKLSLEGLPEGSTIDKWAVDAGVWCLIEKYLNIRKNDTLTIMWGGQAFDYVVSPADAASSEPLRIEVPAAIIAKASQHGPLGVGFTVVDVVGNESGGKYKFSKPYMVRTQLKEGLYEPPILNVDSEPSSQVDFDTQHNAVFELKTFVPSYKPVPNPRHTITVVLTIMVKGTPDEIVRLQDVPDKNQKGETIKVPSDIIAKAAGGQILARVEVNDASGALLGMSGDAQIFVVGLPTNMPAPQVSPLEGTLIPLDTDAAVKIPDYQPHNAKWRETLVLQQGQAGGGGLYFADARQAGEQGGVRDLLKTELKKFENKGQFSIFYRVDNGMGLASSIRESDAVTAEIGVRVVDLPAPIIKYADGGNLDPKDVKRSVLLMSFPYIGATVGSTVFWSAVGVDPEASDSGSILIDASTEGPLLTELLVELAPVVMLNNIGGLVTFSYSVQKDATATTPGTFLRSELLSLTVGPRVELSLPEVLEADKVYQDQLHPKDVLKGCTVRVAYKSMRQDDDIIVRWTGEFGISFIEVAAKPNPATNSVDVVIPPDIIALAIRENGNNITVDYRFTRGHTSYLSQPLTIKLMLVTALPAPTLNKVESGVFQLLALGEEAEIEVPAWIMIQENQRKFLTIKGTLKDGSVLNEQIYLADKVTAGEVANGVHVLGPVEQLRNLKPDSILSLIYSVSFAQRNEADTGVPFGKREYHVQAIPSTLPAPAFDNKTGPTLNVFALTYVNGGNVVVAYPGMTTAQSISLELMLSDGTFVFTALDGQSSGRVNFALTPRFIAQCVGKTLTLRYKVTTGTNITWSDTQIVTVLTIPAENFPQALINKIADKGAVNLATFAFNPTLTLPTWILIFSGQRVWITLRSLGVAQLNVLANYLVTDTHVAKGLENIPVTRAWLEALAPHSTIMVEVAVALDGSEKQENAVAFKTTTYTVQGQLRVEQTYMYLNGVSIKEFPLARTGLDSIGNTQYRAPSGGAAGYTYTSNTPRVASVDAAGKVTGNVNGSAVITVTDKNSTKVSYVVVVSNVWRFLFHNTPQTGEDGLRWIWSIGETFMFDAALYDVNRCYANGWNFMDARWTSTYVTSENMTFFEASKGIYGRDKRGMYPVMCLQPVH